MPETEDRDTVARVKTSAAEAGTQLRALRPDLWIIFANDHVEQFFHTAAPPFTIHVGDEAKGEFARRKFHWCVPGEIGFEIVRHSLWLLVEDVAIGKRDPVVLVGPATTGLGDCDYADPFDRRVGGDTKRCSARPS
jgi:hypothetical protein